jgi:hypothetical protein
MYNVKFLKYSLLSLLLFLFSATSAIGQQQDKNIGLITGFSFQKIQISEDNNERQFISRSPMAFRFGGRALVPVSNKIALSNLQFDLLIQNRKLEGTLDSLGMVSMAETELQFKPVFVQFLPFGEKWKGFGKAGLNTSYALRKRLTPESKDFGPIKFEGFKNLFSAGLVLGGGVMSDSGFFIELSTTADFFRPDATPTGNVSVERSLMSVGVMLGWLF